MTAVPTPAPPSRAFEVPVEGVRGIAAMLVALGHCLAVPILDPTWSPPEPWPYFQAGHAGVMLFFMLSGYVIGLTNPETFSNARVRDYVARRAIRIVPIYLIAWLFSVWVSSGESLTTYLGNLFFLQNLDHYFGVSIPPIRVNGPLWSLNYEMVYYAAFLLVWCFRPPVWLHLAAALAVGAAGWFWRGFPLFLAGYACGWIFWGTGCWLSRQPRLAADTRAGPVLSGVFLLLATHHFACGHMLLNALGFKREQIANVNLTNLSLLPPVLLILAAAARRKLPWGGLVTLVAFGQVLGTIIFLLALGRLGDTPQWLTATVYGGLACALAGFKSVGWLKMFAPFGGISYAFYIIHFPMLFVVQRLPLPRGTPALFLLRTAIWLALSLTAAWFLERVFQVWIKNWWKGLSVRTPRPATA